MTRLLVEYLKEMYAILDNAIQNSDHTDFDQCYWALDELCLHAMLYTEKYRSVPSIPYNMKMYDRDMKYVRGLMNKEEEKAYLDAEMKRAYKLFVKDKEEEDVYYDGRSDAYRKLEHIIEHYKELAHAKDSTTKGA